MLGRSQDLLFLCPKVIEERTENHETRKNTRRFRSRIGASAQSRKDFVADTRSLDFVTEDGESVIHVNVGGKPETFGVKEFAHQQIASRLQILYRYYQKMQEKSPHLLDNNVNVWFQQTPERRLLRVMDGRVRAFLPDRYCSSQHFLDTTT